MIKIVPWADRRLSMKNWRKIWNLFPYGEICMTEIDNVWEHQNWAEKIARYYVTRGREFSVELHPVNQSDLLEELLRIGVKKFYFPWSGVSKYYFFSAFDILTMAQSVVERYPDVKIVIVYSVPYADVSRPPDVEMIKTSITCICKLTEDINQIELQFRYPHPWSGDKRKRILKQTEDWIDKSKQIKQMTLEPLCGYVTILPNTTIYPCSYCKRKKRKKKFGNAARDKYVIGTIEKGLFRNVRCNVCQGGRVNKIYFEHVGR